VSRVISVFTAPGSIETAVMFGYSFSRIAVNCILTSLDNMYAETPGTTSRANSEVLDDAGALFAAHEANKCLSDEECSLDIDLLHKGFRQGCKFILSGKYWRRTKSHHQSFGETAPTSPWARKVPALFTDISGAPNASLMASNADLRDVLFVISAPTERT
jgi:hypothetical protein